MYKKLLGETVIYGVGAVLPRLIIFALTPLFTGQISTADFSIFNQLYAGVSFVNIMLTFGFETAFFRFAIDKPNFSKVLNTSFWFIFMNAFTFLVLMYLLNIPMARWFDYEQYPEYLKWFAWIAFLDAVCVIPFAYLRFKNKPIVYSAIRVSTSLFHAFVSYSLFIWIPQTYLTNIGFDNNVSYPFFANLLASLMTVVLLSKIIFKVRFNFDVELFKKMFPYAYPIMMAGLAFVVNENLDKLVLRDMITEEEAGAYGGCYKLAVLMTLFVTAYRMGIEPFFFKTSTQENNRKVYADILLYFTIICSLVVVGLMANLSWLKNIFIRNDDYFIAMDIVPIIIIANLFFGVYYNLSTWYKITDKTYVGTYISWIGAGVTIVLNLVFIPIVGFMASAWATLFAYGSMMVISYMWGQKSYKIPYKTRKIVFYMLLGITMGVLNYYVFNSNIFIGNLFVIMYIAIVYFIEKASFKLDKVKNESQNN